MNSRLFSAVAAVSCLGILLLGVAPEASADAIPLPDMGIEMVGFGTEDIVFDIGEFEIEDGGKKWKMKDIKVVNDAWGGMGAITIKEIEFDPDPIVYNVLTIQNMTAGTQTYVATVSLPTTFPAPNIIRGSIDTSLIGTSAQLDALSNSSVYSALIDGSTVWTLQDDPFSLTTPQNAVSSSAAFGFTASAIPVNSSIGIRLEFQLSPGDIATIISDFEVTPEPGTMALLLVGGLAVAGFRRRMR